MEDFRDWVVGLFGSLIVLGLGWIAKEMRAMRQETNAMKIELARMQHQITGNGDNISEHRTILAAIPLIQTNIALLKQAASNTRNAMRRIEASMHTMQEALLLHVSRDKDKAA